MPFAISAMGVVLPFGIAVLRSKLHEPLGPTMALNVAPLMVTATVLPGSARPVITGVVYLFLSDEVIWGTAGGVVSTRRFWVAGAEVFPAGSVAVTVKVFIPSVSAVLEV